MSHEDYGTSLLQGVSSANWSRRELLRRALVLGLAVPSASALLAACSDVDDDEGEEDVGADDADVDEDESESLDEDEEADETEDDPGSGDEDEDADGEGTTFVIADGTEPNSIDPRQGTGPFSHIIYAMFEPLLNFTEDLEPVPGLAVDWYAEEDDLNWVFVLKEGIKFHDGTDCNAAAVAEVFDGILNTDIHIRKDIYDPIEEVSADDELTVRFTTKEPFADLPFLLAERSSCIVSPTAAAELGPEEFGLNPVGTGPFQFVEWQANNRILAEKFDDYHGDPPSVDFIELRVVPEISSREAMIQAGEAHFVVSPSPDSLDSLESEDGVELIVYDILTQVTCESRQTQPPFSHKEVRQAMMYAIDSEALIESIVNGLGAVVRTPAPPGIWGSIELEPYGYDPERARELLAEAGYPDGFDCDMRYTAGRWAGDEQLVQAMQAYYADVGINLTLHEMDLAANIEHGSINPDDLPGWTTMQVRTTSTVDNHLGRLYHSRVSAEGGGHGYSNPEVDELLDHGRSTMDEQERLDAYAEAQRILWDDIPFILPMTRQAAVVHRTGVSGFVLLRDGDINLREVQIP